MAACQLSRWIFQSEDVWIEICVASKASDKVFVEKEYSTVSSVQLITWEVGLKIRAVSRSIFRCRDRGAMVMGATE